MGINCQLLKDSLAIVSYPVRWLALEIPKHFDNKGARVIMCSISMAKAESSASWREDGKFPERLEVKNPQGLAGYMHHRADRHSRLDKAVNNTGYGYDHVVWTKRFHQVAQENTEKVIDIVLKGTFRLPQAAIPFMIKNASSAGGTWE